MDFTVDKFINGKATQIDYYVTPDTAKEMGILERNAKGRAVSGPRLADGAGGDGAAGRRFALDMTTTEGGADRYPTDADRYTGFRQIGLLYLSGAISLTNKVFRWCFRQTDRYFYILRTQGYIVHHIKNVCASHVICV